MVYFLKPNTSEDLACPYVSIQALGLARGLSLMGGAPVANRLPKELVLQVSDGTAVPGLTDFMKGVGVCVVSQKLKDIVCRFQKEVEFIPVSLDYNLALHSGYFVFNPPLLKGGVDLDRSNLSVSESGLAFSVKKLVLNESQFAERNVCLVNEIRQIAVSNAMKEAIESAGCSGYRFVEPEAIRI